MKLLINVSVPAIGEKYDILVPDNLRIRNVTLLIAETVENLSNHMYISSGGEHLCSADKNILLRPNATLEKYGIKNGDHLVMI